MTNQETYWFEESLHAIIAKKYLFHKMKKIISFCNLLNHNTIKKLLKASQTYLKRCHKKRNKQLIKRQLGVYRLFSSMFISISNKINFRIGTEVAFELF